MQQAILFVADTLLSLLLYLFLIRLMLQWVRADFRNPIAQSIMRLTNWLVLPLRRALPSIGRIDTASIVAVYAAALVQTAAVTLIIAGAVPSALDWLQAALLVSIRDALWLYFLAIFIYALA